MKTINSSKIEFYYSIVTNVSIFLFVCYVYLFIPHEVSYDPLEIMRIFPLGMPHFEIGIISSSIIFLIIVLKIIFDLKKSNFPFFNFG